MFNNLVYQKNITTSRINLTFDFDIESILWIALTAAAFGASLGVNNRDVQSEDHDK